jgi:transcriptional regulator with XRE-family HTH domain
MMVVAGGKSPHEVDVRAGSRLRLARNMKRMSQADLGRELGITFQQVQKYEKGANRISASKLRTAADILGVSPSFFFDEPVTEPADSAHSSDEMHRLIQLVTGGEALQLNVNFAKIKNAKVRKSVVSLVIAIAKETSD